MHEARGIGVRSSNLADTAMPVIFWDIETRSTLALETAGAWRYAADPTTEVLCVGFAVDGTEPEIWTPGQPIPAEIVAAAHDDSNFVAHNMMFEHAIATRVLTPRYGWPTIPIERQRCTMAMALASALPGGLDKIAAILGLEMGKDEAGYKLMRKMSRPLPRRKGNSETRWYEAAPEEHARLHAYCKTDVLIERAIYKALPPLSPAEQHIWKLDATINARGFAVDLALAAAAHDLTHSERHAINTKITELTAGEITSVDQVERIRVYLEQHGHRVIGVGKRSVPDYC
jgi:DNA polymerase bacteriophage-type